VAPDHIPTPHHHFFVIYFHFFVRQKMFHVTNIQPVRLASG
jgi:hypothetical protein